VVSLVVCSIVKGIDIIGDKIVMEDVLILC
jgi:hypothetical protein